MQNLKPMVFTAEAQASGAGVHEFYAVIGMTILGASGCVEAYAASGTTFNFDVQDDGTDIITAVTANTAGTPGTWLTPALGGTETPVHIAAGSSVEIDINLDTGTADYTIVLFVTLDEV